MSAVVYVLLDKADQPIYIGASRDYGRRLSEHRRSSSWWKHVASAEVYSQPHWDVALYVERNLIERYSPEFNRQSVNETEHLLNSMFQPMFRGIAELTQ